MLVCGPALPDGEGEKLISIAQMGPVWFSPTFAPNQRLIALALADIADDQGFLWPSLQHIAEKVGYSRRQTSRLVRELREMGYVEIVIEPTPRTTPRYRLHPEVITAAPPPERIDDSIEPPERDWVRRQSDTPPDDTPAQDTGDTPEVTNATSGGDMGDTPEVTPVSPEPSENHQDPSEIPHWEENGQGAMIERIRDDTTEVIPRPRNRGFDAVVALFGYEPEGSEAALFGRIAARANREENPEAAVILRATRLIAQWEAKALTPASLDKWWQRFGSPLGAATEEQAARLRDDLEAELRRQRAAALDEEWSAEQGSPVEVVTRETPPPELSGPAVRGHVLDAVADIDDDETKEE